MPSRGRDQQVHGKDEEFAHERDRIMIAAVRKAAREARIPSYCEFATDRVHSTPGDPVAIVLSPNCHV